MKKTLLALVSITALSGCATDGTKTSYADNYDKCGIAALKKDVDLSKKVSMKDDPMGLVVKTKISSDVVTILQNYASKYQCTLNIVSMNDLSKGLLKMHSLPASKPQKDSGYFVLEPNKKEAMDTLGLKLPVHVLEPK